MAKKACNIYRLQDVYLYAGDFGGLWEDRPSISKARKALRDACVRIPRTATTFADLKALAVAAGNAQGFDARNGTYR